MSATFAHTVHDRSALMRHTLRGWIAERGNPRPPIVTTQLGRRLAVRSERRAHDAALADGLVPSCAIFALLFAVFAVWHALEFPWAIASVMVPLAAGTAASSAAIYLVLRRRPLPAGWAHPVAAFLAVLALVNCVVQLDLTGGDLLTVNVLMLVIGVGVCLVDLRWVAGLAVGFALVWIAAVAHLGTEPISRVVSNLLIALVVGAMSNVLRRRTLRRLLQAQDRLEEVSRRCELTGLLNRRGFLELAERRMASGSPVTVWFIDVDDLKSVNDRHGHEAGDLLLREVGAVLGTVFSDAVVARLSGDEFAVLEGAVSPGELARRHERLTERLDAVGAATNRPTQVSAGTASARPGESLEDVLAAADAAMYAVKLARRPSRSGDQRAAPSSRVRGHGAVDLQASST